MSNDHIKQELDKFFEDYDASKKNLKMFIDFELDDIDIGIMTNFEPLEPVKAKKPKRKSKSIGINKQNKNSLF